MANNIHPSRVLLQEFGTRTPGLISNIISDEATDPIYFAAFLRGSKPVTKLLAQILSKHTSTGEDFWINIQRNYIQNKANSKG